MAWGEEFRGGGKFVKIGEGETVELEIKTIRRIKYDPKIHKYDNSYKTKEGGSQGFWDEFITDKGILNVGTFSLAYALKGMGADEGTKVKISHPSRGVYKVEMLSEQPF